VEFCYSFLYIFNSLMMAFL